MSDVLQQLRTATAPMHQSVERAIDLTNTFASVDGYAATLRRLLAVHRSIEPGLIEAARLLVPELALTPRAALLLQDLEVLGYPQDAPAIKVKPSTRTATQVAGVAYVIEGSLLGGAVLARLACQHLQLTRSTGAAFFTPPEQLAARWRHTSSIIASVAERHGTHEIAESAADTFTWIEQQLSWA